MDFIYVSKSHPRTSLLSSCDNSIFIEHFQRYNFDSRIVKCTVIKRFYVQRL